MHALRTKIAIQRQNAKIESAFVKERELETGKTAGVRLVKNTDLIEWNYMEICCLDVIHSGLCGYHFQ